MVVQKVPALMMAELLAHIINLGLTAIVHLRGGKARRMYYLIFVVK
jgi:hypothetical protein